MIKPSPFYHVVIILSLTTLATSTHSHIKPSYTDLQDLHQSLSDTLSEMQTTLYEIKSRDTTDMVYEMSKLVGDLTEKVKDLQEAKYSLEEKVSSLQADMDCVMGRSDGCNPQTCLNGGTLVSAGKCTCKNGFTGNYCEKDVNECEVDNPCKNGGQCKNTYSSYECLCPFDYYGKGCQYQYNDCDPNPCGHGSCMSFPRQSEGVPHKQCYCQQGWKISADTYTCSQDINECEDMYEYCDSLAVQCRNTVGSFECQCPEGYFGSGKLSAEGCMEIESCEDNPCHMGTCEDLDIGFRCDCERGWGGVKCTVQQHSWCDNNPCQNNGNCYDDEVLMFRCECPLGYNGTYCEHMNICEQVVCENEGTCVTEDNVHYTCQCGAGFAGRHCEGREEACADKPCYNEGGCVPTNNELGFICECPDTTSGTFCKDKVIYELNSCGIEGPLGPGTDDCKNSYKNQTADAAIDVVNGIQNIFIKEEATYQITAKGASGGSVLENGQPGGYPIEITAVFKLQPGYMKIAIGQAGQCNKFDELSGKKSRSVVCGGGGGTFIVTDNEPLIIAGGGGGAGDNGPGINGSETIEGTHHHPNNGALGGMLGDGGKTCQQFGGAGGSGFITSGEDGYSAGKKIVGTGGRPWPDLRGGMGEPDQVSYGATAYGGFGGGGRATWSPGGGGGYSGGAGKCSRTGKGTAQKGGGGGGSLVNSRAESSTVSVSECLGQGRVTIIRIYE